MADVCTKCITGNNIKTKDVIVVKSNGGKSFQSTTGTLNNNLHSQMDTKYDSKFDNTDFHTVTP